MPLPPFSIPSGISPLERGRMLRPALTIAGMVAAAVVIGLVAARLAPARLGPEPTPTPTPLAASPTPVPTAQRDDDRVWQQPLSAGCAVSSNEAYVVSNGGGLARFDGRFWTLIDDSLRQLRAATCVSGVMVAAGEGGRVVRVDPTDRAIRSDVVAEADLFAVGGLDPRELYAAGADLALVRLHDGRWEPAAVPGSGLAWRAVLARSPTEVWLAGDQGRLAVFDGRTFVDRSIPNGPDLTALAPVGVQTLVGGRDGRVFVVRPAVAPLEVARVDGAVRSLVGAGPEDAYVLADDLRRITYTGSTSAALVHGLSCVPEFAFGSGRGDIWVVARSGGRWGMARHDGNFWTEWGVC